MRIYTFKCKNFKNKKNALRGVADFTECPKIGRLRRKEYRIKSSCVHIFVNLVSLFVFADFLINLPK